MKKAISLLLLLALLLPVSACSENREDNTEPEASQPQSATGTADPDPASVPEETEYTRPPHKVPDSDFGGADFVTAYPEWQGYRWYFFADEQTGDGMNDAIFERKVRVEDAVNVKIGQENCGSISDVVTSVRKTVQAGDDTYQMGLFHCIQGIAEMVTGGVLYNLDDLPNVDLAAEWWNQDMMDVLRLGSKTLYGVSDYMIPCPYAIFFNKDMVTQYQLDNPYGLVYEGEWTFDRYLSLAAAVTSDQNGNGKFEDEDVAGMMAEESSKYQSFVTGCGQYLTSRDENGRVTLDMNTEKMYAIVEKMYSAANNPGEIQFPPSDKECVSMYAKGNILFCLNTIASAVEFRDIDFDLGILPYPKFDSQQENYISLDWGGLMGVPATIRNPEMVGAVIELLSYESADTVIPAYYDVLLTGKLARDTDTVAMIDILFDTITYEIGGNYFGFSGGFNALFYTLGNEVVNNKNADFASFYAKNEKSALATIKNFYKQLDKAEANP